MWFLRIEVTWRPTARYYLVLCIFNDNDNCNVNDNGNGNDNGGKKLGDSTVYGSSTTTVTATTTTTSTRISRVYWEKEKLRGAAVYWAFLLWIEVLVPRFMDALGDW